MEPFNKLRSILDTKKIIIIATIMIILTVISVESIFSKEITIRDKEKEIAIETLSSRVDKALKKADVTLGEHDQLSIDKDTKLKDGMIIEVKRAFDVKLNVDGKEVDILTANNKVADILNEYDITLGEKDKTEPSLDEKIVPKDTINVIRVKEEIVKETVGIPYRTVIKYNNDMETGQMKKINEGENGTKEVEYRIVYENGIEAIKEVISENIKKEPVDEMIEKGSEKYFVASRGEVVRYKKVMIMSATAYDLSYESCGKYPDHPEYGITRSGTRARPGVVAVDPRVIPLGTKLYVEYLDGNKDYGLASAEDTGGAIKGNKIDLFMENSKDVYRFGRRKVRVYILE
ncbi:3D domain-containing protein [Wukongibacter baidiensis]|uniref:3D domain-containing protein n=1 Tax=Wukongibacter baidiensis TaxID=1723361 RepID=UPI003D7F4734